MSILRTIGEAIDFLRGASRAAPDAGRKSDAAHPDAAYTIAIIALSAKMAKSDGIASTVESDAFYRRLHVDPGEIENVRRFYDQCKRDVAGFEVYAERVRKLAGDDKELLIDVLEGLFHVAAADGILHPAESEYLTTAAGRLGLTTSEFRHVRAMFVAGEQSPYEVLGVEPSIGNAELKAHYRAMVRENHPDRHIAKGLPPELVVIADRKLAAINHAYDEIARERGL